MTPIQEVSIPLILKKKDILAQAKTGSGKTAAFGIGLLENLKVERFRVQNLIICPTRELAEQVSEELRRLARFRHNIKILKITGGYPQYKQEHSLKHQAHIVVGTPGRVNKLLKRGTLILDELSTIVLDEADRMLDMGFIDQIEEIFSYAPEKRQTLCFSATFPDDIKRLSRSFQNNPKELIVESQHDQFHIDQHFYIASREEKSQITLGLLNRFQPESALVFCNTKDACRRLVDDLNKAGLYSLALHGDLEQKERTEILIRFANGSSRVLVATDVAARGLDIDDLGAVINFDLPFETETYIHRIGRTGRAGKIGKALSLMRPNETFRLEKINEEQNSSYLAETTDCKKSGQTKMPEPAMITLSINGGRRNKISPGDLLGALTVPGGLSGSDVGKIDRQDYICFFAVKRESAPLAIKLLEEGQIKGRRFKVLRHD